MLCITLTLWVALFQWDHNSVSPLSSCQGPPQLLGKWVSRPIKSLLAQQFHLQQQNTRLIFAHRCVFSILPPCCYAVRVCTGFIFENNFDCYMDPLLKFQGPLEVPSQWCKALARGTPFQSPVYFCPSALQWDKLPPLASRRCNCAGRNVTFVPSWGKYLFSRCVRVGFTPLTTEAAQHFGMHLAFTEGINRQSEGYYPINTADHMNLPLLGTSL